MGEAKLNIQGLSRSEKRLMGCMIADPGKTLVSVDLSAGEPTVTTHFSQDKFYKLATFDMVGKDPYWENGILVIDDIYLMTASVSPLGREIIRDAWLGGIKGRPFIEVWREDSEIVKGVLKEVRKLHKIIALALAYGLGPKGMVGHAAKHGYKLSLKVAREFYNAYWDLFKDVRVLGKRLEAEWKRKGYLVNPFGYRLVPTEEYKCLNYFIQSTVSGIMNALMAKFFAICPEAEFVTVVHDEVLFMIPDEKLYKSKELMGMAVADLNEDLGWTVNVRSGWAPGKDLYTAK